jgi:ribose 5-phosphate isomerase A
MTDDFKRLAAIAALDEIRDGMVVGLGTGSTASHFIQELGARVGAGLSVVGIPTSEASAVMARQVGIPLTDFSSHSDIDVTVDGADEVSPDLELVKGLGGALVREKIVAKASRRVVIVVDEAKLVERLGSRAVIPVEVIPFAADLVMRRLASWGGEPRIRQKEGKPFVSDNGNLVVDWKHGPIEQPSALEKQIKEITGVVDSGLFCGIADAVIVSGENGVRKLERNRQGS